MKQIESFFWGIIAALGALVVEFTILTGYTFFTNPFEDFSVRNYFAIPLVIIGIAAIEEIFKYVIIIKRIEYLSLERSFIVNSLFLGLGFAVTELFFIKRFGLFDINHAHALVEITILHMATAAFIGYRIAIKNHKRILTALSTLIIATAMHSIYNLLVSIPNERILYVAAVYVAILVLISVINLFKIKSKLAA